MGKHLILAGGGHAHVAVIDGLKDFIDRGHSVTLVSPAPRHHYSGMGPGMLGGAYTPDDISFPVEAMATAKGAAFVQDAIERIDSAERAVTLASGTVLHYDVLSLNIGSGVPTIGNAAPGPEDGVYPVKPIDNLLMARERMLDLLQEREPNVLVVGGGPAALEIAGNTWGAARRVRDEHGGRMPRIRILAGKHFLSRAHPGVARRARKSLTRRDISIIEHGYATSIAPGSVTLDNGEVFSGDIIFLALGVRPPELIAASGLPTGPDGGLSVNRHLQSIGAPRIFGGGDCIHFKEQPLDKVGVYAVRQHAVLPGNLLAALEGRPLTPFNPGGQYLLVYNLGDGTGIFHKGPLVFGGAPAWWIKDFIDRRFMEKFRT